MRYFSVGPGIWHSFAAATPCSFCFKHAGNSQRNSKFDRNGGPLLRLYLFMTLHTMLRLR
jgi:hypothetical protein